MRQGILFAIAGVIFLTACGDQGNKTANVPTTPKWKGTAYHISADTAAVKPNAAGVTIPVIKYSANPDALERRISLMVRFDTSGVKQNEDQPTMDQMIMAPADISGADGALSADYMDAADTGLARLLGSYCLKGKIKLLVGLANSSITPRAGEAEVNSKRVSDWLPIEVVFKNPHPCARAM